MSDLLHFHIRTSNSRSLHTFRLPPTADHSWRGVAAVVRARLGFAEEDRLELEYRLQDDEEGTRQLVTNAREWDRARAVFEQRGASPVYDLVEVEGDHVSWEIRTVDRFKEIEEEEVDIRSATSRRSRSSRHSRSRHSSRPPSRTESVPRDESAAAALAPESSSTSLNVPSPLLSSTESNSPVEQGPDVRPPLSTINTSAFLPDLAPLVASPTFTHNAGPPSVRSASPPLPLQPMDLGDGFDERRPKMRLAGEERRHRERRERERDRPQEYGRRPGAEHRRHPADQPGHESPRRSGGHRSHVRLPPGMRDEEGSFRPPFHRTNSPRFSPPTSTSPQSTQTAPPIRLSVSDLLQQIDAALEADKTMFYTIKGALSDWQERRMEKKSLGSAQSSSVKGPSSVASSITKRPSSRLHGRQSKVGAIVPAIVSENKHDYHTDTSTEEKHLAAGAPSQSWSQRPLRSQSPATSFRHGGVPAHAPQHTLRPSSSMSNLAGLSTERFPSKPQRPASQQNFSAANVLRMDRNPPRFFSNGGVAPYQQQRPKDKKDRYRHTWDVTDTDDTDNDTLGFTTRRHLSPPSPAVPKTRKVNSAAGPSRGGVPSRDYFGRATQEVMGRIGTGYGFFDFDDFAH